MVGDRAERKRAVISKFALLHCVKSAPYEAAGYKPDRGAASRLSANVSVRARLNELLEKAAERTLLTVESLTEELEKARQFALQANKASAVVSASMSKAKLHKLLG